MNYAVRRNCSNLQIGGVRKINGSSGVYCEPRNDTDPRLSSEPTVAQGAVGDVSSDGLDDSVRRNFSNVSGGSPVRNEKVPLAINGHGSRPRERRVHRRSTISAPGREPVTGYNGDNSIGTNAHHHQIARITNIQIALRIESNIRSIPTTQGCIDGLPAVTRKEPVRAGNCGHDSLALKAGDKTEEYEDEVTQAQLLKRGGGKGKANRDWRT